MNELNHVIANGHSTKKGGAKKRKPKHKIPRILQHIFPSEGQIVTLNQFLLRLATAKSVPPRFLFPSDSDEYRQLITSALVGVPCAAPPLQLSSLSFKQESTMSDVITLVIANIFRTSGKSPSHVLTQGYGRQKRPAGFGTGSGLLGVLGIEVVFPSTLENYLRAPIFETLLSRVGDNVMTYLLQYCVLLTPLPNKCYLQLSGPPLADLLDEQGRAMSLRPLRYENPRDVQEPPSLPPPNAIIPRAAILYNMAFGRHPGLPKTHILNTFKVASCNNARLLLKHIFASKPFRSNVATKHKSGRKSDTSMNRQFRVPKRLVAVVPVFARLIANHIVCPYTYLLEHHCPIDTADGTIAVPMPPPNSVKSENAAAPAVDSDDEEDDYALFTQPFTENEPIGPTAATPADAARPASANAASANGVLIRQYTSYHRVAAFVKSAIIKIVPSVLWGTTANREVVMATIERFVRLRRYETFYIAEAADGFSLNACAWLGGSAKFGTRRHVPPNDTELRRRLLMDFLRFLFQELVVPLIRMHFYVTESASAAHGKRLFYFRKPLWGRVHRAAMDKLASSMFHELSDAQVSAKLAVGRLGYSFLRFVPKPQGGMRPIVNLRKQMRREASGQAYSVNGLLKNTFHALKWEKSRNPTALGASVFSLDDIYRKLVPFVQQWRAAGAPPLSVAVVDIKACFDTIHQEKVFAVVHRLFTEDEYLVQRYTVVAPGGPGRAKVRFCRAVCGPPSDFPQFVDTATQMAAFHRHTVFTDRVVYVLLERTRAIQLLKEHVFDNTIRVGNRYYRQKNGISQGSVLSSLLCSLLYGDFENTKLAPILQAGATAAAAQANTSAVVSLKLLMRFIDDWAMFAVSRAVVTSFIATLHRGDPTYGCRVNLRKSRVNFDLSVGNVKLPQGFELPVADDVACEGCVCDQWIPWCGLLLNTRTMEIRGDYLRFAGNYVGDMLTGASPHARPGAALRSRMHYYVRHKVHPLLLDGNINSTFTVRLNIYQTLLMAAMKFHCHVREMPRGVDSNPKFFAAVVVEAVDAAWIAIKRRALQTDAAKAMGCRCPLKAKEVHWMGFYAFEQVLARKQTQYRPLLAYLKKELGRPRYKKVAQRLQSVVQPKHHATLLRHILY